MCLTLKTEVGTHRDKHGIGPAECIPNQPCSASACNPDDPTRSCPHPDGRAFDAREAGITSQMLEGCKLYKRYPENDGVHLELIPTPAVDSITPSTAQVGNNNNPLKIKITGKKFYRDSKVYWRNGQGNAQMRPTIVLKKETELEVTIPATDLQNTGTNIITVVNPNHSPLLGSGTSNAKNFFVNQSFQDGDGISGQSNGLQNAPTISDPRVSVKVRQESVNGAIRYSYRVINNSQRSINNLMIGYDNQRNYTLYYPPMGWDIFTGTPATNFTSPTNWGFDVLWDEGTDLEVVKWDK